MLAPRHQAVTIIIGGGSHSCFHGTHRPIILLESSCAAAAFFSNVVDTRRLPRFIALSFMSIAFVFEHPWFQVKTHSNHDE
jgi:hypothetical protein